MTNLFCFIVSVLLLVVPLSAQELAQELPELQEWYRWQGAKGKHISYLPGFSADGGMNAITQKRNGDPTWFNRFAYDTTNQFSWNGGAWTVVQLDLNGDGMPDYIDGEGRVYPGLEKGKPPGAGFGRYERGGDKYSVADFNKDGFEDVLGTNSETSTFRVIFGGKDLTRLRSTQVDYLRPNSTGISAYLNEHGESRLLTYNRRDYSEGYYLDAIQFEAKGDSIVISFIELDKIEKIKQTKDQQIFEPNVYSFYQSKVKKEYSFFIWPISPSECLGYAIENDKFRLATNNFYGSDPEAALTGSIDGDSTEDYLLNNIFYIGSVKKRGYYLISGNPLKDTIPHAYFYLPEQVLWGRPQYIGDVTGDGVGDIAYGQDGGGLTIIYKGINWRKLSVEGEIGIANFTLHQTEPNPVSYNGMAILPTTLTNKGDYTLEVYDLTGKRLGELFHGELPAGEVRIPLNLKTLLLTAGMYKLRLSEGRQTQERAIVITK